MKKKTGTGTEFCDSLWKHLLSENLLPVPYRYTTDKNLAEIGSLIHAVVWQSQELSSYDVKKIEKYAQVQQVSSVHYFNL
jgi:hypothetical protein